MRSFKEKLLSSWENRPPSVQFITQTMPDAPELNLSGSGVARMSIDTFIRDLEREMKGHIGHYYAYVMGGCKEEADTYCLEGWVVYTSPDCVHEATVLLYYSALNPYLTLKKYFDESSAEEYLARNFALSAISDVFAEV